MTYIKRLKELNFNSLGGKWLRGEMGEKKDKIAVYDAYKELGNGRKGQEGYFQCLIQNNL